jgi:hypothetical protein
MEEVTLQDIVDAAQGIDTKRFVAGVDDFIKAAARLDAAAGGMSDERREAVRRRQEEFYDTILEEAGKILTRSTLSVSCIINFRFQLNGRAGRAASLDDSTLYYFRKMRKHQIELLLGIGNEISMIRDTLKHSRRMQEVFQQNAPPVAQAALFMTVVRERIEARPTTLLRVNGSGRKIEQLNHTFSDIQSYEDSYHRKIRQEAEANPMSIAMEIFADLTSGALRDMEDRRNRLKVDIKELEKGRKLMIRLATDGYSPFMKKHLDRLVASHLERSRGFAAAVREWRKSYYIEEPI